MTGPEANAAAWLLETGDEDAPAVLAGDAVITYGQLRRSVDRVALELLRAGLSKGERVVVLAENGPFFVAAYLGVMRAGLCAVPLPTAITAGELGAVVRSTEPRAIFISDRLAAEFAEAFAALHVEAWTESRVAALEAVVDPRPFPDVDPAVDLAALMFTSGSTGGPKGVMVTHANIRCNTADIVSYLALAPSDRVLIVLPLFYCFGASLLHTHLRAGASAVLARNFTFPERALDELEARACSGFAGVPSTYQVLLRRTRFAQRRFPSLRWLQQAGGRLPEPFIREIRAAFPEVRLFVMYGQTEATARLSYLPPEKLEEKPGSIGRGLPSTRLEVLGPDGRPVAPGSAAVGEIVASGGNVTRGYWKDPLETARYFRDGRLHTNDLARVDADGFIFITGRSRDFIKAAGHRVSPREIEDVVAEMPAVVEVAVFGAPDELLGEAIHAWVVERRAGSVSAAEVLHHCNERLPNYKVPATVEIVDRLPKNAAGKVLRAALGAAAASRGAAG